jgi:hypothetical protein
VVREVTAVLGTGLHVEHNGRCRDETFQALETWKVWALGERPPQTVVEILEAMP